LQEIENTLKEFYQKQKRIAYFKQRYEQLDKKIKILEKQISDSNHTLEVVVSAMSYDGDRVSTSSKPSSPQEKALLDSEKKMEQLISDYRNQQTECLLECSDLELDCEQLAKLIELLDEDDRQLCELRYQSNKSFREIGRIVQANHATVKRWIENIEDKINQELGLTA
jgi:DNA-directed RNA polymerase specialized sigma subunit